MFTHTTYTCNLHCNGYYKRRNRARKKNQTNRIMKTNKKNKKNKEQKINYKT